ncbi:putative epoxide hydrolase [Gordonia paraffinivorans NBRC 108238]|uniref:Epoxide hydrolase n=1 Tax=Gordonia paraffinivorans NBRC 108238 TaxID=1223543 RepID=A0ABQ0IM26_9ACTN|nr:epoxide hydrolase family protein [Gordonia paraffinivorans]GAC84616.1 putative epoxide hydrolase [Gordonia paraffinivorans NBRC 108238]
MSGFGELTRFQIDHAPADLDDLRRRIVGARWPEPATDASQGISVEFLREVTDYWADSYDWWATQQRLNALPQYTAVIDGLRIHFVHVRSSRPDATAMILTHGWPGSFVEFEQVIGPLTEPPPGQRAFHVVIPSLPGYGYSAKPTAPGWNFERTAQAWGELMRGLGYSEYVAQGGDWGALVTSAMAQAQVAGLQAIHLNLPLVFPEEPPAEPTAAEQRAMTAAAEYSAKGTGYYAIQATRPQTVGYGLADSPVGQAAWILDKVLEWTDHRGDPWGYLDRDRVLDIVTIYWLTNSAASSARYYWENARGRGFRGPVLDLPVGVSVFPKELYTPPREWAAAYYRNLIHWGEPERGGHFAALEQPELFVTELRTAFA